MILSIRRLGAFLLPPGSLAYNIVGLPYRAWKSWRERGVRATLWNIADRVAGSEASRFRRWILNNEPDAAVLAEQRRASRQQRCRPLISIITPTYKTPIKFLRAAIQSVIDQTYENWELCIANGSPDLEELRQVLDAYAKQDPRIKVTHLTRNMGIAGNTNAAVALASGDFVGFLDHDDLLAPFALFEVVKALDEHRAVDLIYSDEDKTGPDGSRRRTPFFKPAFSPDFLEAINYMPHLLMMRRKLGDDLGWFRNGFEGSQDYDLILRACEEAREIAHVTRILYHWRAWERSAALTEDAKGTAAGSGKKALEEHLRRMHISGTVHNGPWPNTYSVARSLTSTPLVSIIIPNRDHAVDLRDCIESILRESSYTHVEIIIVENGSKEEATRKLYDALERLPNLRLVRLSAESFNYSIANNYGADHANGEVLLFLNNDVTVIARDWLERMLENALRPEVAIVGAKLYYPNNTVQHGGVLLGIGGVAAHAHYRFPRRSDGYFCRLKLQQNLSAITGACMMVRRQVFREVGGFDPGYQLAFGDVDLCMKVLAKGYLVVYSPSAELYHHESRTRGSERGERKQERFRGEVNLFRQKWSAELARGDDYYSPNLTQVRHDFSINTDPVRALIRCKPGFRNPQDPPRNPAH